MAKRLMCLVLSVLMIVSLLPIGAFADSNTGDGEIVVTATESTDEEADEETTEDEEENTGEGEETEEDAQEEVEETEEDTSAADAVQAMIDSLPDASEITSENASLVEALLDAIDVARAQLGEEADYLDYTKYDAAIVALEIVYASETTEEEVLIFDEFVPSVELPDGAVRSDKIPATSVASAIDEETTTNVVSIDGGTTSAYSSITDAIDAITTSGTITLTGDLSEASITIPSGKTITLNLNGHTLTLTGCTTYTDTFGTLRVSLLNRGALTVTNGTILATTSSMRV